MQSVFQSPIEYLKGVGPARAELLKRELGIFTFADLLQFFPYRYEDRTQIVPVSGLREGMGNVLVKGTIKSMERVGEPGRQRLVALLYDGWSVLELVFFQRTQWLEKTIVPGQQYLVFGTPKSFLGRPNMVHPEVEAYSEEGLKQGLLPVYHTTDVMKSRRCDSKAIQNMVRTLMDLHGHEVDENLPDWVIEEKGLISKKDAVRNIHFPESHNLLAYAQRRLKFEELLNLQVRLLRARHTQKKNLTEVTVGPMSLVTKFLEEVFPYPLTDAQRKVLKEITSDLKSGKQMNRLLQGDVGSGKTVVAFVAMLMVVEAGFQAAMLAPTEILTEQHFANISGWAEKLGITCMKLTGSVPKKEREPLLADLQSGQCQMLIGTHAIIEGGVQFKALGLSIIDEQHRFGVDQRAALKAKGGGVVPHMLVMTATPIPRTLALSLYGDLDVSTIDQMPKGRKPIRTVHRYDKDREKVHEFIRSEVTTGRQAYIVYPLIEESEKVNLNNLLEGYELVKAAFPEYKVSMVHGRMKWAEREVEMKAFLEKTTQIMVATTVIEVGVDVPNASVMLIENSERFGLSQLHQLRGRVGRGADQSYCILMTGYNLTQEGRERLKTMVESTDGFYISEQDLKLRGSGDIMGTQQSGYLKFLIADLIGDTALMVEARDTASQMLEDSAKTMRSRHYLDTLPTAQGTGHDYLQIA